MMPRSPVLDWSTLTGAHRAALPALDDLRRVAYTTSGRAAIFQALKQLQLAPGSTVLLPSYHCPTMVAPAVVAGLRPVFYAIGADGLPDLAGIQIHERSPPRAMLVAHYFGLPRNLSATRAWCDRHRVALIEDCAHSYFGQAGERPVGAWGDFATGSLSKFLPVPEAGVLASATRELSALVLQPRGPMTQLKGMADVLELSARHGRLRGVNGLLRGLFGLKGSLKPARPHNAEETGADAGEPTQARLLACCDMSRRELAPLWVVGVLARRVPRQRIVARRQANYMHLEALLGRTRGARPLLPMCRDAAPYVSPLWVDDADRVYHALRAQQVPVLRWDRVWPGATTTAQDCGPRWSRRVLQFLYHQDLGESDIERMGTAALDLLRQPARGAPMAARLA